MSSSGDFSLHVVGQAEGFEQAKSSVLGFAGALDQSTSSVQRFASSTSGISSGFGALTAGTDQMTAGFAKTQEAVDQFGAGTADLQNRVGQLGSSFSGFGGTLGQTSSKIQPFNAGITTMGNNFSATLAPIKSTGDALANNTAQLEANTGGFKRQFSQVASNITQMGFAVGAVTGLVFSYTHLEAAHLRVERSGLQVSSAQNKVDDLTRKLTATVDKYGAASEQAAAVQADLTLATDKLGLAQERAELIQRQYTESLVEFATQAVPTAVGVVGTLIQSFEALGGKAGILSKLSSIGSSGAGLGFGALGGAGIIGGIGAVGAGLGIIANEFLRVKQNADINNQTMEKFQTVLDKNESTIKASQNTYESVFSAIGGAGKATAADIKSVYDSLSEETKKTMEDNARGAIANLDLADKMIEQRKKDLQAKIKENTGVFGQPLNQFSKDQAEFDKLNLQQKESNEIRQEAVKILDFLNPQTYEYSKSIGELGQSYLTTGNVVDRYLLQQKLVEQQQQLVTAKTQPSAAAFKTFADNAAYVTGVLSQGHAEFSSMNNAMSDSQQIVQNLADKGITDLGSQMTAVIQNSANWTSGTKVLGGTLVSTLEPALSSTTAAMVSGTDAAEAFQEKQHTAGISSAQYKGVLLGLVKSYGDVKDASTLTTSQLEDEVKRHENLTFATDQDAAAQEKLAKDHDEVTMRLGPEAEMTKTLDENKLKIVGTYRQEAAAIVGVNGLLGLRNDQIARLALTEEVHEHNIRADNQTLLDEADAVGISANVWIKYAQSHKESLDDVEKLNAGLRGLINTQTDALQIAFKPTQEQIDKLNMSYTAGVVGVKTWADGIAISAKATQGAHDTLVKATDVLVGDWLKGLKFTDPEMQLIIQDFLETGNVANSTAQIMNQYLAPAFAQFSDAINANKLKDLKKELKDMPGFKDFSSNTRKEMLGVVEDLNKVQKRSQELKTDVESLALAAEKGVSGKSLHNIFSQLATDVNSITKVDVDAGPMKKVTDFLGTLSGTELRTGIRTTTPALRAFYAALLDKDTPGDITPEEMQAIIAKYPEVFDQVGIKVNPVTGKIEGFNSAIGITATNIGTLNPKLATLVSHVMDLGDEAKTSAEKYQALNDAISKSGEFHVFLPQLKSDQPILDDKGNPVGSTGEIVGGGKDGKDGKDGGGGGKDDFGLAAMQAADKMAIKLNQDFNKYVIAGMNLVGNKSAQLLDVMGGNFDDLAKQSNKDMVSMNQTMNKYLIAGMNLTGNKSNELLNVMGGNFDDLSKQANKDMISMNQVMNKYVIAGMNLTGNKSAELDKVMGKNFDDLANHTKQWANNMKASIDKVTGAMMLAEDTAKSLATAIGKLKDKDINVTTHFKTTGKPPSGGGGGFKIGNAAEGGLYFASHATSMTFGEAGDELALFLPMRKFGEGRRGDFDINVPTPYVDTSAIKNMISDRLGGGGHGGSVNLSELLGKYLGGAQKTVTVVLNQVEKVVMNEHEIMQIVRKRIFKQELNQL